MTGRYYDMSDKTYRESPGLSKSMMQHLRKSPGHLLTYLLHPPEPTEAQAYGIAVHEYMLGTHGTQRFTVRPLDLSPYTKEGKVWKADQINTGKIVISQEEMTDIKRMKEALMFDKEIEAILNGAKEISCFADLEVLSTKVLGKGRIDAAPAFSDCIVDIKTCKDASDLDKLAWDCFKYGYHLQATHYLDLYNATCGPEDDKRDLFMFIFVEIGDPYGIRKVMLTDAFLDAARKEREELMLLYAKCSHEGHWPLYPNTISVLDLPKRNLNKYLTETL